MGSDVLRFLFTFMKSILLRLWSCVRVKGKKKKTKKKETAKIEDSNNRIKSKDEIASRSVEEDEIKKTKKE